MYIIFFKQHKRRCAKLTYQSALIRVNISYFCIFFLDLKWYLAAWMHACAITLPNRMTFFGHARTHPQSYFSHKKNKIIFCATHVCMNSEKNEHKNIEVLKKKPELKPFFTRFMYVMHAFNLLYKKYITCLCHITYFSILILYAKKIVRP